MGVVLPTLPKSASGKGIKFHRVSVAKHTSKIKRGEGTSELKHSRDDKQVSYKSKQVCLQW